MKCSTDENIICFKGTINDIKNPVLEINACDVVFLISGKYLIHNKI